MLKARPRRLLRDGFTIVELLIVIVVIGILAAITIVAYNGVQARAQDTRRVSDMKAIQSALALYSVQYGSLPAVATSGLGWQSGWESSAREASGEFLRPLVTGGIIGAVPVDPVNNAIEADMEVARTNKTYSYAYYLYPAGSSGCDVARGDYYILGMITTATAGSGTHTASPGFSCTGRDWQNEFSWVAGGYTSN